MNDSNNNIVGNNKDSSSLQDNNQTGVNPISNSNDSINNVNPPIVDVNNVFGINLTTTKSEINQNPMSNQSESSFFNQTNNTVSDNNMNQIPKSPLSVNNMNTQSIIQSNQDMNSNISLPQSNQIDDNELLKAFIGSNYEKITTKSFNIAGFFFTTFYMFYRKMFGYAILIFLLNFIVLNVIKNYIVILVFNVIVGFIVNKIYLFYSKKKVAIIKSSNSQKSLQELKAICSNKGGTSIGKLCLGFVTEVVIALVVIFIMALIGIGGALGELFNFKNWNITTTENGIKKGLLVENVSVSGYSCFNSKCTISIEDSTGITTDYLLGVDSDLFSSLGDYKDYIKLNINYTQKENVKTIVGYEIYLKSNNDDITSVKTENELRDKIGLYSVGTHTDSFTLIHIGTPGLGFKDDTSYAYTPYIFRDSKNREYEMNYINDSGALNLIEGSKYDVTFEVVEDSFGYEFIIKTIK